MERTPIRADASLGPPAGDAADGKALVVRGLTKVFAGQTALDSLDLTVGRGECHALLGENGSGKSTLIKCLSGYYRPEEGEVVVAGQQLHFGHPEASYEIGCRFIHQDLGLVDGLSALDNMFLSTGFPHRLTAVRTRQARAIALAALDRLEVDVDLDAPVASLTPAQRTGIAVARALRADRKRPTRLLVMDEPTAALPAHEVDQLLQLVRRVTHSGVSVIYVTHHLDEVFTIADNVSVLRDGRLVRSRPMAGVTRAEIVSMLLGDELEHTAEESHAMLADTEARSPALVVRDLAGDNLIGVDFEASPGEIVGLAGITGSGRETCLGSIFGALDRSGGSRVTVNGQEIPPGRPERSIRARLAYLPADRRRHSGLMSMTCSDNLTLTDMRSVTRRGGVSRRLARSVMADWCRRLDVRPADRPDRALEGFSGGNQQKILFAKWLRTEPQVFLLDEPTHGVDIGAKARLHHQLVETAAAGAAVVISSSDVDELAAICTRVLVLRGGRVVRQLGRAELSVSSISRAALANEPNGVVA